VIKIVTKMFVLKTRRSPRRPSARAVKTRSRTEHKNFAKSKKHGEKLSDERLWELPDHYLKLLCILIIHLFTSRIVSQTLRHSKKEKAQKNDACFYWLSLRVVATGTAPTCITQQPNVQRSEIMAHLARILLMLTVKAKKKQPKGVSIALERS